VSGDGDQDRGRALWDENRPQLNSDTTFNNLIIVNKRGCGLRATLHNLSGPAPPQHSKLKFHFRLACYFLNPVKQLIVETHQGSDGIMTPWPTVATRAGQGVGVPAWPEPLSATTAERSAGVDFRLPFRKKLGSRITADDEKKPTLFCSGDADAGLQKRIDPLGQPKQHGATWAME
jgi:hypothetical protein